MADLHSFRLNRSWIPSSRLFVEELIQFPSWTLSSSAFDNYRHKIRLKLPSLAALKRNIDYTGKELSTLCLSVIKGQWDGSGPPGSAACYLWEWNSRNTCSSSKFCLCESQGHRQKRRRVATKNNNCAGFLHPNITATCNINSRMYRMIPLRTHNALTPRHGPFREEQQRTKSKQT